MDILNKLDKAIKEADELLSFHIIEEATMKIEDIDPIWRNNELRNNFREYEETVELNTVYPISSRTYSSSGTIYPFINNF